MAERHVRITACIFMSHVQETCDKSNYCVALIGHRNMRADWRLT